MRIALVLLFLSSLFVFIARKAPGDDVSVSLTSIDRTTRFFERAVRVRCLRSMNHASDECSIHGAHDASVTIADEDRPGTILAARTITDVDGRESILFDSLPQWIRITVTLHNKTESHLINLRLY